MRQRERPDEPPPPSRSQQRRDALDVLKLAETLAALSAPERDRIPLPDSLRDEVARTGAISQHIARKRQTQYLAKQLRNHPDAIEPIRRALEHDRRRARAESAALHQLEAWRTRLLADDGALGELIELKPDADRQRLHVLIRQARIEAEKHKPPRACRELFHLLRELFGMPA
ncbi:MAG TPA: ribosome biogenesis factor YjgA [Rhodanobacteraceae bacterium]|nr:ribosome biogenesis factor YjgA [Rhodanobacteraceae bacterium]